ncbi:Arc family DNA-binding protein [Pseudogemmobacter sonorensis]|uniref:Arc family DNA-binding protein n=1 Tax=Pseudogemmobacter sonorensis TaxID=2989681 RepID=UPI0036890901
MQTQEMRIRVPYDLRAWIEAKASDEGRSLNRQIVQIIKAAKKSEQGEAAQ